MINKSEARSLIWKHMKVRVDHAAPAAHLRDLIYGNVSTTKQNRVNPMREELIEYIKNNKQQLSLFCPGDCYQHPDVMVLNCYTQLLNAQEESGGD